MIAMKFAIARDIGLPVLLQAAAAARDRSRDENSSSWAVQAIVGHCRGRTGIPESGSPSGPLRLARGVALPNTVMWTDGVGLANGL